MEMKHGKGERSFKDNSIPAFADLSDVLQRQQDSESLHLTQSARTGCVRATPFSVHPDEVNIIIHRIVPYYEERILPACPVAFLSSSRDGRRPRTSDY